MGEKLPDLPNLALIGRAGSGKTTAANYLVKHRGYDIHHFASPLKRAAEELWENPGREELQRLGIACREIDENVFVDNLLTYLDEFPTGRPVVVDDCRFPNEVEALEERGFMFIRIWADEDTRVHRLQAKGKFQTREQLEHESETALDDMWNFDEAVPNPAHGTRIDFYKSIDRALDRLRARVA